MIFKNFKLDQQLRYIILQSTTNYIYYANRGYFLNSYAIFIDASGTVLSLFIYLFFILQTFVADFICFRFIWSNCAVHCPAFFDFSL